MPKSLRDREWLWELLLGYSEAYDPVAARAALPSECFDEGRRGFYRAKIALRSLMRQSGLRYGLPLRPAFLDEGRYPADALFFLSALSREFDLCGAAALVLSRGLWAGARRRDLLVFLAALLGDPRSISRAEALAAAPPDDGASRRFAATLERPLQARGESLVADPVLGLPLHNGLVYSDARLLGRIALDTYRHARFRPRGAARLRRYAHRERAALAEALMLLVRAEQPTSVAMRRSILSQLRALGLPGDLWRALRQLLEFPRSPRAIAQSIPSLRTRNFLLEQVVLGSLADGWKSPRERAFLKELAGILEIPAEELARIETDLAEFYAAHPDFVDRFRLQDNLASLRDQAMDGVEEFIDRNWSVLVYEARQGRELTAALSTLARGGKLDAEQQRRLRSQLLDLAKTLPGLALFAAPGGLLLTMALSKLLPRGYLPSILEDPRKRAANEAVERAPPPERTGR